MSYVLNHFEHKGSPLLLGNRQVHPFSYWELMGAFRVAPSRTNTLRDLGCDAYAGCPVIFVTIAHHLSLVVSAQYGASQRENKMVNKKIHFKIIAGWDIGIYANSFAFATHVARRRDLNTTNVRPVLKRCHHIKESCHKPLRPD